MKIHLIQYIVMLELVYGEYEPLIYKIDTYRSKEENKQEV